MSRKVPLEDVFDGYCEYEQCIYNDNKQCFIKEHISEYMNYKEGSKFATCIAFSIKEGYCEECGAKLQEERQGHPYGDTVAYEYYYACPSGC